MATRQFIPCAHCGALFKQAVDGRKYCGRACYSAAKAPRPKSCQWCGVEFVKAANHPTAKFCSNACLLASRRVRPHVCRACGTVFSPIKFKKDTGRFRAYTGRESCSDECAFQLKGERTKRRMAETRERWVGPNNPMWVGAALRKNRSYRGPDWPQISEKIRKRDKYACRSCGMTAEEHQAKWGQALEVHHIVPFYEFTDHRKANAASNLVTLCKSCHMAADRAVAGRQLLIDLADEPRKKARDGVYRGSNNGRAQLTEDSVAEIKRLIRASVRHRDIADRFGVKPPVISAISTGQNWRHVPWPA